MGEEQQIRKELGMAWWKSNRCVFSVVTSYFQTASFMWYWAVAGCHFIDIDGGRLVMSLIQQQWYSTTCYDSTVFFELCIAASSSIDSHIWKPWRCSYIYLFCLFCVDSPVKFIYRFVQSSIFQRSSYKVWILKSSVLLFTKGLISSPPYCPLLVHSH